MRADRPCILVYNPISGHGHLDSWNAMFVSLLLDQGWRVLALTPDIPALTSRLARKNLDDLTRLQVLDWNARPADYAADGFGERLRRAWSRWNQLGTTFGHRRAGGEFARDARRLGRWKARLFRIAVPPLFLATRLLHAGYRKCQGAPDRRSITTATGTSVKGELTIEADARIETEANYLDPGEFGLRVCGALNGSRWTPALVLNMYMDMYKTDDINWARFSAWCALPWGGIRFVPPETPFEGYYGLPSLRGMCFLDENACRVHRERLPAKRFEHLPDVTDATLPDEPSELVRGIKRLARGRKIVFLGGSIGGQKNLARWFEVVRMADPDEWYFVQVGELHQGTLTAEDTAALARVRASQPENLFIKAEYLPDEAAFNDVIRTADVIFAVYRDFRISSNMPGKAASFRKPILVSDRYLMGDAVTRYGIGLAVPEDSAMQMLVGLEQLARNSIPEGCFMRYSEDFSERALAEHLVSFITECAGGETR